jgi:hypothetical protein
MTASPRARLITGMFAVLIGATTLLLVAPRFKRVQRRAPPAPLIVQTTLPQDPERVAASLRTLFNEEADLNLGTYKLPSEDPFHHFYLYPSTHPIFPDDFQIRYLAASDPYLRPYAELPADKRHSDFYLYEPTGDRYWPSDYFYNGAPAKFRCAFLIHLESQPNHGTTVAVFEYLPTIWVGQRVGFSAHAIGPTSLDDIRFVESTNSDRLRLLNKIQQSVH